MDLKFEIEKGNNKQDTNKADVEKNQTGCYLRSCFLSATESNPVRVRTNWKESLYFKLKQEEQVLLEIKR